MKARLLPLPHHGAPETPGLPMGHADGTPAQDGIDACVVQTVGVRP